MKQSLSWEERGSRRREESGFGRQTFEILVFCAAILLMLTPMARAGVTGPDVGSNPEVTPNVAPRLFSPVNTTAQGSCTTAAAACAGTPCASGHSCFCISNTNFPIKLPGAGAVTLNTQINLDPIDAQILTGVSVCYGAYGTGTGSLKSGDTINIFYNGQICGTGTGTDNVGGTWLVTGGTGKLATASGTGLFSQNMPDAFSTGSCVYTMDGAFRQKP